MASTNEQKLKEDLKQSNFLNCYLFYGKEQFLIKKYVKKMTDMLVPPKARSFNYSRFFQDEFSWEDVENISQMVPVVSEKRIILLDGIYVNKLTKNDINIIKKTLKNIPQTTVIIVAIANPEANLKNSAKLKQLNNIFSKIGRVVEFAPRLEAEAIKILSEYVKKQGGKISKQNLKFLIERCGNGLEILTNQLDKILAYAQEREIEKSDILLLTTPTIENSAFDITKCILQGKTKNALIILDNLLDAQTPVFAIMVAINMCFIDLYRAKCARLSGKNGQAILDFYQYKGKEFRIKNAMRDCSKYSLEKLRRCVTLLSDLDIWLKTTSLEPKYLIEKTIISMIQEG